MSDELLVLLIRCFLFSLGSVIFLKGSQAIMTNAEKSDLKDFEKPLQIFSETPGKTLSNGKYEERVLEFSTGIQQQR